MKLNSQIITVLLIVWALMASTVTPAFADSRSATFRVTCTILPVLEISTLKTSDQNLIFEPPTTRNINRTELELKTTGSMVSVETNLGQNYHLSEVLLKKLEGTVKLYSVTAS